MGVQVEKFRKNMGQLTIEVPAEELEKALEKATRNRKRTSAFLGFRKGKKFRLWQKKSHMARQYYYEDAVKQPCPEEYSVPVVTTDIASPSADQRRADRKGDAFIFTATGKKRSYPWRVQRSGSSKS